MMAQVFRDDDRGQDLAEYCMLVALIALVALGLMVHFAGGMQNIWNSANHTLASGTGASQTTGGDATDSKH